MYEQVEKTQEKKSQSVSAVDSQMQSGAESTFQFVDNRPEAIQMQKLQELAKNSPKAKQAAQLQAMAGNYSTQNPQPIQFVGKGGKGKKIKDSQQKLHPTKPGHRDVRRRVARSARMIRSIEDVGNTGRNVFVSTIRFGGRNRTFHLRSAGLGGKHPRYGGRSAAHTEQIWEALIREHIIQDYLKMKSKPKVTAMYSRNAACDSNPSNPHGCRSIPKVNMGMSSGLPFHYSTPYTTGAVNKPPTLVEMSKLDNDGREPDSDDEYVDVDKLRGKDIEKIKPKDFSEMVTKNP